MCEYKDAVKCLAEKYIIAEYYAVGKDFSKVDKKRLKQDIIHFISQEFETIYETVRRKIKNGEI